MAASKIIILVLVVIGVLVFMALGAGAYRDKREGGGRPPKNYKDPDTGIELIDAATGWMRSKFDIKRMHGCGRNGTTIPVSGSCEVKIAPGSSRRPSRFRLVPISGTVTLCFALARKDLTECMLGNSDPAMAELEEPENFTVTRDSAFLFLRCDNVGPEECSLRVR
jgi:hypothetical protein